MTIETIHLLPQVTCNIYIISIQNVVPKTKSRKKEAIGLLPKISCYIKKLPTLP